MKKIFFFIFIFVIFSYSIANISADDLQLQVIGSGDNQLGLDQIGGDMQTGNLISTWWPSDPTINIIYPQNNSNYAVSTNFNLNYTVTDVFPVSVCKYNVKYQNVFFVVTNTTTDCSTNQTFNTPVSGWYIINFWANNSPWNNTAYKMINITNLLGSSAVNLYNPTNASYINNNTVVFNFTATDVNNISQCQLWTNFTINWSKNDSSNSIISGAYSNFTEKPSDGYYKWDTLCNNTLGVMSDATHNYTFTLDIIPPSVSIQTINNVVIDGLVIALKYNISDLNINTCSFTLTNSTGQFHNYPANSTLDCNSNTISLVTLQPDIYTIHIYGTDKAGNTNSSFINFTTTNIFVQPQGGGSSNYVGNNITGWSITTDNGGSSYELNIIAGASRTNNVFLENNGTVEQNIGLTCVDVNGSICKYVNLQDLNLKLPLQKQVRVQTSFIINLPSDFPKGYYVFNILGVDNFGRSGFITVKINTDIGLFTAATQKIIFQPLYLLFYLFIALILGYTSDRFIFKKVKVSRPWSATLSTIFGIGVGIIIIGLGVI